MSGERTSERESTPAAQPAGDSEVRDETEPEQVPEAEQPDVDDEGHMAPDRAAPEREAG